jgi:hypothetical protein
MENFNENNELAGKFALVTGGTFGRSAESEEVAEFIGFLVSPRQLI